MNYSISPLTKLLRENDIPSSPLVKGRGKSTGNYGNVVWYQIKDGYTWSKSRGHSVVHFEIRGREVYDKMVEVLTENNVEIKRHTPNDVYGGYMEIDLKQFNEN